MSGRGGGGLIQLVAVGSADTLLTTNPQITYFKSVYKRHSAFAMECVPQTLQGHAEYGGEFTVTLGRDGDLVTGMHMEIDFGSELNMNTYKTNLENALGTYISNTLSSGSGVQTAGTSSSATQTQTQTQDSSGSGVQTASSSSSATQAQVEALLPQFGVSKASYEAAQASKQNVDAANAALAEKIRLESAVSELSTIETSAAQSLSEIRDGIVKRERFNNYDELVSDARFIMDVADQRVQHVDQSISINDAEQQIVQEAQSTLHLQYLYDVNADNTLTQMDTKLGLYIQNTNTLLDLYSQTALQTNSVQDYSYEKWYTQYLENTKQWKSDTMEFVDFVAGNNYITYNDSNVYKSYDVDVLEALKSASLLSYSYIQSLFEYQSTQEALNQVAVVSDALSRFHVSGGKGDTESESIDIWDKTEQAFEGAKQYLSGVESAFNPGLYVEYQIAEQNYQYAHLQNHVVNSSGISSYPEEGRTLLEKQDNVVNENKGVAYVEDKMNLLDQSKTIIQKNETVKASHLEHSNQTALKAITSKERNLTNLIDSTSAFYRQIIAAGDSTGYTYIKYNQNSESYAFRLYGSGTQPPLLRDAFEGAFVNKGTPQLYTHDFSGSSIYSYFKDGNNDGSIGGSGDTGYGGVYYVLQFYADHTTFLSSYATFTQRDFPDWTSENIRGWYTNTTVSDTAYWTWENNHFRIHISPKFQGFIYINLNGVQKSQLLSDMSNVPISVGVVEPGYDLNTYELPDTVVTPEALVEFYGPSLPLEENGWTDSEDTNMNYYINNVIAKYALDASLQTQAHFVSAYNELNNSGNGIQGFLDLMRVMKHPESTDDLLYTFSRVFSDSNDIYKDTTYVGTGRTYNNWWPYKRDDTPTGFTEGTTPGKLCRTFDLSFMDHVYGDLDIAQAMRFKLQWICCFLYILWQLSLHTNFNVYTGDGDPYSMEVGLQYVWRNGSTISRTLLADHTEISSGTFQVFDSVFNLKYGPGMEGFTVLSKTIDPYHIASSWTDNYVVRQIDAISIQWNFNSTSHFATATQLSNMRNIPQLYDIKNRIPGQFTDSSSIFREYNPDLTTFVNRASTTFISSTSHYNNVTGGWNNINEVSSATTSYRHTSLWNDSEYGDFDTYKQNFKDGILSTTLNKALSYSAISNVLDNEMPESITTEQASTIINNSVGLVQVVEDNMVEMTNMKTDLDTQLSANSSLIEYTPAQYVDMTFGSSLDTSFSKLHSFVDQMLTGEDISFKSEDSISQYPISLYNRKENTQSELELFFQYFKKKVYDYCDYSDEVVCLKPTSEGNIGVNMENGNYVFQGLNDPHTQYGMYTGTYTLLIPQAHPISLLNNGMESHISYQLDSTYASEFIEIHIAFSSESGYTFSSGGVQIGLEGDTDVHSFHLMKGKNYKFVLDASGGIPIDLIYQGSTDTLSPSNTYKDYANYDGTPIVNNGVSGTFPQGQSSTQFTLLNKEVGGYSYDFFYGSVEVNVTGDFGLASYFCYYHGYMGGENKLKYTDQCNVPDTSVPKLPPIDYKYELRSDSYVTREPGPADGIYMRHSGMGTIADDEVIFAFPSNYSYVVVHSVYHAGKTLGGIPLIDDSYVTASMQYEPGFIWSFTKSEYDSVLNDVDTGKNSITIRFTNQNSRTSGVTNKTEIYGYIPSTSSWAIPPTATSLRQDIGLNHLFALNERHFYYAEGTSTWQSQGSYDNWGNNLSYSFSNTNYEHLYLKSLTSEYSRCPMEKMAGISSVVRHSIRECLYYIYSNHAALSGNATQTHESWWNSVESSRTFDSIREGYLQYVTPDSIWDTNWNYWVVFPGTPTLEGTNVPTFWIQIVRSFKTGQVYRQLLVMIYIHPSFKGGLTFNPMCKIQDIIDGTQVPLDVELGGTQMIPRVISNPPSTNPYGDGIYINQVGRRKYGFNFSNFSFGDMTLDEDFPSIYDLHPFKIQGVQWNNAVVIGPGYYSFISVQSSSGGHLRSMVFTNDNYPESTHANHALTYLKYNSYSSWYEFLNGAGAGATVSNWSDNANIHFDTPTYEYIDANSQTHSIPSLFVHILTGSGLILQVHESFKGLITINPTADWTDGSGEFPVVIGSETFINRGDGITISQSSVKEWNGASTYDTAVIEYLNTGETFSLPHYEDSDTARQYRVPDNANGIFSLITGKHADVRTNLKGSLDGSGSYTLYGSWSEYFNSGVNSGIIVMDADSDYIGRSANSGSTEAEKVRCWITLIRSSSMGYVVYVHSNFKGRIHINHEADLSAGEIPVEVFPNQTIFSTNRSFTIPQQIQFDSTGSATAMDLVFPYGDGVYFNQIGDNHHSNWPFQDLANGVANFTRTTPFPGVDETPYKMENIDWGPTNIYPNQTSSWIKGIWFRDNSDFVETYHNHVVNNADYYYVISDPSDYDPNSSKSAIITFGVPTAAIFHAGLGVSQNVPTIFANKGYSHGALNLYISESFRGLITIDTTATVPISVTTESNYPYPSQNTIHITQSRPDYDHWDATPNVYGPIPSEVGDLFRNKDAFLLPSFPYFSNAEHWNNRIAFGITHSFIGLIGLHDFEYYPDNEWKYYVNQGHPVFTSWSDYYASGAGNNKIVVLDYDESADPPFDPSNPTVEDGINIRCFVSIGSNNNRCAIYVNSTFQGHLHLDHNADVTSANKPMPVQVVSTNLGIQVGASFEHLLKDGAYIGTSPLNSIQLVNNLSEYSAVFVANDITILLPSMVTNIKLTGNGTWDVSPSITAVVDGNTVVMTADKDNIQAGSHVETVLNKTTTITLKRSVIDGFFNGSESINRVLQFYMYTSSDLSTHVRIALVSSGSSAYIETLPSASSLHKSSTVSEMSLIHHNELFNLGANTLTYDSATDRWMINRLGETTINDELKNESNFTSFLKSTISTKDAQQLAVLNNALQIKNTANSEMVSSLDQYDSLLNKVGRSRYHQNTIHATGDIGLKITVFDRMAEFQVALAEHTNLVETVQQDYDITYSGSPSVQWNWFDDSKTALWLTDSSDASRVMHIFIGPECSKQFNIDIQSYTSTNGEVVIPIFSYNDSSGMVQVVNTHQIYMTSDESIGMNQLKVVKQNGATLQFEYDAEYNPSSESTLLDTFNDDTGTILFDINDVNVGAMVYESSLKPPNTVHIENDAQTTYLKLTVYENVNLYNAARVDNRSVSDKADTSSETLSRYSHKQRSFSTAYTDKIQWDWFDSTETAFWTMDANIQPYVVEVHVSPQFNGLVTIQDLSSDATMTSIDQFILVSTDTSADAIKLKVESTISQDRVILHESDSYIAPSELYDVLISSITETDETLKEKTMTLEAQSDSYSFVTAGVDYEDYFQNTSIANNNGKTFSSSELTNNITGLWIFATQHPFFGDQIHFNGLMNQNIDGTPYTVDGTEIQSYAYTNIQKDINIMYELLDVLFVNGFNMQVSDTDTRWLGLLTKLTQAHRPLWSGSVAVMNLFVYIINYLATADPSPTYITFTVQKLDDGQPGEVLSSSSSNLGGWVDFTISTSITDTDSINQLKRDILTQKMNELQFQTSQQLIRLNEVYVTMVSDISEDAVSSYKTNRDNAYIAWAGSDATTTLPTLISDLETKDSELVTFWTAQNANLLGSTIYADVTQNNGFEYVGAYKHYVLSFANLICGLNSVSPYTPTGVQVDHYTQPTEEQKVVSMFDGELITDLDSESAYPHNEIIDQSIIVSMEAQSTSDGINTLVPHLKTILSYLSSSSQQLVTLTVTGNHAGQSANLDPENNDHKSDTFSVTGMTLTYESNPNELTTEGGTETKIDALRKELFSSFMNGISNSITSSKNNLRSQRTTVLQNSDRVNSYLNDRTLPSEQPDALAIGVSENNASTSFSNLMTAASYENAALSLLDIYTLTHRNMNFAIHTNGSGYEQTLKSFKTEFVDAYQTQVNTLLPPLVFDSNGTAVVTPSQVFKLHSIPNHPFEIGYTHVFTLENVQVTFECTSDSHINISRDPVDSEVSYLLYDTIRKTLLSELVKVHHDFFSNLHGIISSEFDQIKDSLSSIQAEYSDAFQDVFNRLSFVHPTVSYSPQSDEISYHKYTGSPVEIVDGIHEWVDELFPISHLELTHVKTVVDGVEEYSLLTDRYEDIDFSAYSTWTSGYNGSITTVEFLKMFSTSYAHTLQIIEQTYIDFGFMDNADVKMRIILMNDSETQIGIVASNQSSDTLMTEGEYPTELNTSHIIRIDYTSSASTQGPIDEFFKETVDVSVNGSTLQIRKIEWFKKGIMDHMTQLVKDRVQSQGDAYTALRGSQSYASISSVDTTALHDFQSQYDSLIQSLTPQGRNDINNTASLNLGYTLPYSRTYHGSQSTEQSIYKALFDAFSIDFSLVFDIQTGHPIAGSVPISVPDTYTEYQLLQTTLNTAALAVNSPHISLIDTQLTFTNFIENGMHHIQVYELIQNIIQQFFVEWIKPLEIEHPDIGSERESRVIAYNNAKTDYDGINNNPNENPTITYPHYSTTHPENQEYVNLMNTFFDQIEEFYVVVHPTIHEESQAALSFSSKELVIYFVQSILNQQTQFGYDFSTTDVPTASTAVSVYSDGNPLISIEYNGVNVMGESDPVQYLTDTVPENGHFDLTLSNSGLSEDHYSNMFARTRRMYIYTKLVEGAASASSSTGGVTDTGSQTVEDLSAAVTTATTDYTAAINDLSDSVNIKVEHLISAPLSYSLFESIEFQIGGQTIDVLTTDWLYMRDQLYSRSSHSLGKKRLNGHTAMFEGDLNNSDPTPKKMYMDVPFWFTQHPGNALPMLALQYHDCSIRFKLNPPEKIFKFLNYDLPDNSDSGNGYTVPSVPNPPKVKLWVDYVMLDNEEREKMAKQTYDMIITQTQFLGSSSVPTNKNIFSYDIVLNHPVKELIWAFRKDNGLFQYNVGNENFLTDPQDIMKQGDIMKSCRLLLNGSDRFAKRNGKYFRLCQPTQHHTRIPDKNIYCYSFALRPEQLNFTGSLNFSRIDSAVMQFEMDFTAEDGYILGDAYDIIVFAPSMNILHIESGMGGLLFSN